MKKIYTLALLILFSASVYAVDSTFMLPPDVTSPASSSAPGGKTLVHQGSPELMRRDFNGLSSELTYGYLYFGSYNDGDAYVFVSRRINISYPYVLVDQEIIGVYSFPSRRWYDYDIDRTLYDFFYRGLAAPLWPYTILKEFEQRTVLCSFIPIEKTSTGESEDLYYRPRDAGHEYPICSDIAVLTPQGYYSRSISSPAYSTSRARGVRRHRDNGGYDHFQWEAP